ncbi:spherulation-specific family 4 protein [Aquisphaera insulae]|uniref:spherulation-specific family 4 protein n=1 Tax=Aquisphaera insulae TaxID=2712864 RepID=UPI0013ED45B8|nr:spherulation-specific family 4 protein [Aquisphaera insulae]
MRRPWPILGRLLLSAVTAAAVVGTVAIAGREGSRSWIAIVPAYFYPGGSGELAWETIAATAREVPLRVILNPSSGPGRLIDSTYAAACRRARAAGARILGYVHTSYGLRDPELVRAEVVAYLEMYEVDGLFIDEMSSDPRSVPYYASLRRFITDRDPRLEVVGNPGTLTDEDYRSASTADVVVLFEGTAESFESFGPPAWALRYPADGFAAIVHGARTERDMRRALNHAAAAHLGAIFITDGDGPNPYDHLPGYWPREAAALRESR